MSTPSQELFLDGHLAGLLDLTRVAPATTNFINFVHSSIAFLKTCGFRSVRYYECATNRPRNDEVLILSAQSTNKPTVAIAYSIPYRTSTLGRARDPLIPAIGSSTDTNEKWVGDLNLMEDCAWIDIPVRASGRLIGLVAADWKGKPELLSQSDIGVLATLGTLIACASESASNTETERIERAFIASLYDKSDNVEDALRIAIHELVSTLNFGVVSVFQRTRGGSRLRKILEEVHPSLQNRSTQFPEEYSVGSYLTGVAWERNESRHIVDFASQIQKRNHEVEQKSLDRHNSLLGEIKSVLYSRIDSREPQFMIRIMNCVDSDLPIVGAQRKIVDAITKSIAIHLDDVIAKGRLRQIIDIAKVSSKNITRPKEVVAHARTAIKEERFDELIVVASRRDQSVGTLFVDLPKEFKNVSLDKMEWSDAAFSQIMTSAPNSMTVYSPNMLTDLSDSPLFAALTVGQYPSIIIKPFESPTIRGFLALPSKESIKAGRVGKGGHSLGDVAHLMDTYAAVISSSIDGYESHVTAEGSRKFMGSIGHEVRAPALDSVQASIFAIAQAQRAIAHAPKEETEELRSTLQEALLTVNRKAKEIDRMMELAKLAALQEVGNTQFNFQIVNIKSLLLDVIDSLKQQGELVSIDKAGVPRNCIVVMNKAVSNIGTIVGDATYLRVIFSHILRNAAKYSLPRYSGVPIEINIIARPEPQSIIMQVTNWGVGIDQAEFDTIFRPHKRGSAHDRRKAIGGLGLGLHVTRMLVSAHKGVVFCHHSTPTLDNKSRVSNYEGYETAFELRLPRNATIGLNFINLGLQT